MRRWAACALLLAVLVGCGTTGAPVTGVDTSSVVDGASSTVTEPATGTTRTPTAVESTGALTAATSAATSCEWSPCYAPPVDDGEITAVAPEASGVAAATGDPGVFYLVDDGTGTTTIQAIRADGTALGDIAVEGMSARNAEALVSGPCDGGSCLFVGDIGGNSGRSTVTVHRLPEPDPAALPASTPSQEWTYRYPDGSYNAEAMLVGDDGGIVIITKPDGGVAPHRVYTGPAGGGDLTLHTTFTPPVPARPAQSAMVGNVVTDASRQADRVLLLTYDQAIEYLAPTPGADPADFPLWPYRQVATPGQWQSEGVAYRTAPDCGFVVVSEKSPMGGPVIGSVGCA